MIIPRLSDTYESPLFSLLHKGMTFLIKLYDDDKKVLKIYFQPHKLSRKVSCVRSKHEDENGLLMEVILMHWAAFISHIMENEYRGEMKKERRIFRSIPNCIYVVKIIWIGRDRVAKQERLWDCEISDKANWDLRGRKIQNRVKYLGKIIWIRMENWRFVNKNFLISRPVRSESSFSCISTNKVFQISSIIAGNLLSCLHVQRFSDLSPSHFFPLLNFPSNFIVCYPKSLFCCFVQQLS